MKEYGGGITTASYTTSRGILPSAKANTTKSSATWQYARKNESPIGAWYSLGDQSWIQ